VLAGTQNTAQSNPCIGLRLSDPSVLLVSRVQGSMTACLVSPAMVESTASVAVVRLLSCSSGYALTVSLPTVSPIVDPSDDPTTCSATLPDTVAAANSPCLVSFRLFCQLLLTAIIYGDLSYSPGIICQSVRTSRVFD